MMMTIGLLTNIISPHQIPLAQELAKIVGEENYRYIYTEEFHGERARMGWNDKVDGLIVQRINDENDHWLLDADLVYSSNRNFDLIEARLAAGKKMMYMSERWFKPIFCSRWLVVGGWVRMLVPRYYQMCKRFVKFFESPDFKYLPQGLLAKDDMMAICKWFTGKTYEEKMVDWGYFVAPSENKLEKVVGVGQRKGSTLKVLWVGRMLKLKRVDTIIRAIARIIELEKVVGVGQRREISLTLVGDGPERERLMKLAKRVNSVVRLRASTSPIITFLPSQPIAKIREIMREHDIYVFSSNGMDGWGAVVSEAVEEGMKVLGTYETGAAATILPESNLFHCGDYKTLAKKLMGEISVVPIGNWSARRAAERMIKMIYK